MKHALWSLPILILVAIVAWWLELERPDVRYTLSGAIPLSIDSQERTYVQQLEVKNVGNRKAEDVVVRILRTVDEHDLRRHSHAAAVEASESTGELELVYETLPPAASFTVTLRLNTRPASASEISIAHAAGLASEALASVSEVGQVVRVAYGASLLAYLALLIRAVRGTAVDSLARKAEFDSEKIALRHQPWYTTDEEWSQIVDRAIKNFGASEIYKEITSSELKSDPALRLLNSEKPAAWTDERWETFCLARSAELTRSIVSRVYYNWAAISADEILGILALDRPKGFAEDRWRELAEKLEELFVSKQIEELFARQPHRRGDKAERPREVNVRAWQRYEDAWSMVSRLHLFDLAFRSTRPHDFLRDADLTELSAAERETLVNAAYILQAGPLDLPISEWTAQRFLERGDTGVFTPSDFERVSEVARAILAASSRSRDAAQLESVLQQAVAGHTVSTDELEGIRDASQRRRVADLCQRIATCQSEFERETAKAAECANACGALKEKILQQLQVIERLFADPRSIERLESYAMPFSAGNYELLRRLGSELAEREVPLA